MRSAMNVSCTVTLTLALSCCASTSPPASQPARAPDPAVGRLEAPRPHFGTTPVGKVISAWYEAFNSGDEARIREFASTYKYPAPDELIALRNQTGGLQITTLALAWEIDARFVATEKSSSAQVVGWIQVKDIDPPVIDMFELAAIPPDMNADQAMERARKLADEARSKHKK